MSGERNLIEIQHLQQYFPAGGHGANKRYVQAVDDVSLFIRKGETLGLVGESGCGKTTVGRTMLRLYEPTDGRIIYDGKVIFDSGKCPLQDEEGRPVLDGNGNPKTGQKIALDMLPYRRKMQIVFQDPYASLDPRMTIGDIVGESIDIHKLCSSKQERHDRIISLLERVGLNSEHANRYPHEFSGGQRQRIGIARALIMGPEFIIADEPISALDVSIRAQVLNLLAKLQKERDLTYLFVAHDLSVMRLPSFRRGALWSWRKRRSCLPIRCTPIPGRCCRRSRCLTPSGSGRRCWRCTTPAVMITARKSRSGWRSSQGIL